MLNFCQLLNTVLYNSLNAVYVCRDQYWTVPPAVKTTLLTRKLILHWAAYSDHSLGMMWHRLHKVLECVSRDVHSFGLWYFMQMIVMRNALFKLIPDMLSWIEIQAEPRPLTVCVYNYLLKLISEHNSIQSWTVYRVTVTYLHLKWAGFTTVCSESFFKCLMNYLRF